MTEFLTYTSAQEIVETIEEIRTQLQEKGGIRNLYLLGCGGSLAGLYPLDYFMRSEAKNISCRSMNANEFVYDTPKGCGENSIVICMSLAGTTPETVAAAKKAEEVNARKRVPVAVKCAWAMTGSFSTIQSSLVQRNQSFRS